MRDWAGVGPEACNPPRRKQEFQIPGAWVIDETNTFVRILRYDGPEGFEAKNRA
ncbi:MAG TPA: hypothetical protein VJN63_03955 [Thermoplasmata archaeon]|nr:hypothetical protein [Thermoplasmata archaeon]